MTGDESITPQPIINDASASVAGASAIGSTHASDASAIGSTHASDASCGNDVIGRSLKRCNAIGSNDVRVGNGWELCDASGSNDVSVDNDVSGSTNASGSTNVNSSSASESNGAYGYSYDTWGCDGIPYMDENVGCGWDQYIYPTSYPNMLDNTADTPYVIENEGSTYIESTPIPPPPSKVPQTIQRQKNDTPHTPFFVKEINVKTKYNDSRYYFDMEDIFSNVTLGRSFSDEYYEFVNNHVCNIVNGCCIDSLQENRKIQKLVYSFNGGTYYKTIVMYDFGQYSMVAYALLDWAVHNPEKIA